MFNGLPERLTKEMYTLISDKTNDEIRVINSPERKFSAWRGGNIMSSIPNFESSYIRNLILKSLELVSFIENASKKL